MKVKAGDLVEVTVLYENNRVSYFLNGQENGHVWTLNGQVHTSLFHSVVNIYRPMITFFHAMSLPIAIGSAITLRGNEK